MTTYDDILTCFFENCSIEINNIIDNDERKKEFIHNGIKHYNNKMSDNILFDDDKEIISKNLNDSQLLILAYCLKYISLSTDLENFISIYSMFQKEIGFKDYKDQLQGRERIIENTNHKIIELITNMEDGSIM